MEFRLIKDIPQEAFPPLYPKVERELPTAKSKGWTKVGGFTLRDKVDLMPQVGLQEALCTCEANLIFICGAATSGKAQPYDARVLTPNGFVNMGDLKVGDVVTGANGKPQLVEQIYEQGEIDVCRFTMSDGAVTESSLDHLWVVRNNGIVLVKTTADVLNDLQSAERIYFPKHYAEQGRCEFAMYLKEYKFVGKKRCRCIRVSNADHLYVTDDFIVTHNTYGMYLKSLYGMDKAGFTAILFSYREKDSKKGSSIFRDGVEVLGNYSGCEYASSDNIAFRFPKYNAQLQLANFNYNVNNPSEWADYREDMKKKQASLIMVDEMTKMEEKAMLYLFSRNRDSSGMIPQFIGSFNPEYDHFTREVIQDAGFLDETWHVKKGMEGKLKYFFMKGKTFKDVIWGDTPEEVVARAGIEISERDRAAGITEADMCKTFTVFTGEAADNRILVAATGGQSVSNLAASGDADVLKGGSFAPRENEASNVSRAMIQALWENPINDDENMYATFDVGGGKGDSAPMIIWKGLQMIAIEYFKGEPTDLANWLHSRLSLYGVRVENFAYDASGFGFYLQGLTNGIPVTANKRPLKEYDEYGNESTRDEYFNCRSQLLGKLEVALKKGDISCAIDANKMVQYGIKADTRRFIDVLTDGMALFVTTHKNGKIYYKSKDEFKARYKYSPGEIDSMALRMVFELDTRERKQPSARVKANAYDALTSGVVSTWGKRTWNNNYHNIYR